MPRADTIRGINRQIVLNYVRERAPISRAHISSETQLQRPTISLVVDELKAQGLIKEIEGHSTGGRPTVLLQLRAAGAIAIGVDVGYARTVVATSDLVGRVLEQEEFAIDPSSQRMLDKIVGRARKLSKKRRGVEGIGISVPGLVDTETGNVLFVPNLNGAIGPLRKK